MYNHPTHTSEELSDLATQFNASLKPSYEDLEKKVAEQNLLIEEYKQALAWLDGVARYYPNDPEDQTVRTQVFRTIGELSHDGQQRIKEQIQVWDS